MVKHTHPSPRWGEVESAEADRVRGTAPARSTQTARARRLRVEAPLPERLLWGRLRARRLAGWKFRRQAPLGRYIVDLLCPDAWLIVELDGGQHSADAAVVRDAARSAVLEASGYIVVRFWNGEVLENLDGVCDTIMSMLRGPSDL